MKLIRKASVALFLGTLLFMGCKENVDESARYVFNEQTIISYMEKHPETYSEYLDVLRNTNVSEISQSTVYQLLTARGHYTVFATTNEAIYNYLQELTESGLISSPSWDGFATDVKRDSIRKVIAYNSVIDGKDEIYYETSNFPTENNSEMPLSNMNDRKLTVRYVKYEPDSLYINYDCPMSIRNRDIPAINGVVHQMEKVIAPKDITLAALMADIIDNKKEGFIVASRVALTCGLRDTFNVTEDFRYRNLYMRGLIPDFNAKAFGWVFHGASGHPMAYAPEHRRYGFTMFAETDAFWREQIGKEPSEITCEDVQKWVYDNHQYTEGDVFTTDNNWTSPNNLLNQWVTYHVLPVRIPSNKLVYHVNEYGFSYSKMEPTIPVYEFYATMGKRRLLKIYESRESEGIYLNRFPNLDNGRRGTYHELSCDPDKVGNLIDNRSVSGTQWHHLWNRQAFGLYRCRT